MKKINKTLTALVSAAILSTSSLAASDELKILPIFTDKDFCLKTELAITGANISFDENAKDGMSLGAELSLGCPIFTLPGNNPIRQQFSLNKYSEGSLSLTTVSMNPYYFINLSKDLVLGFGPGIGGLLAEVKGRDDVWLFTYQASVGVKYYIDDFLIGLDVRKQWSAEKDLDGIAGEEDLSNMRLIAKVGYSF